MNEERYTNIILEEMRDKFNIVMEGITGIHEQLTQKADKSDIQRLEGRINVLEYSIRQHNESLINPTFRNSKGATLK